MVPFFLSVAFVVGIVVASFLWRREVVTIKDDDAVVTPEGGKFPFERVETVLNEFEQAVLRALEREVGRDFFIFAKVQLGALVQPRRRAERKEFYLKLARNRVVDFVLCDRESLKPALAVQLVDNPDSDTHDISEDMLRSASITFLKLPAKKILAPSDLHYRLREAMQNRRRGNEAEVTQV